MFIDQTQTAAFKGGHIQWRFWPVPPPVASLRLVRGHGTGGELQTRCVRRFTRRQVDRWADLLIVFGVKCRLNASVDLQVYMYKCRQINWEIYLQYWRWISDQMYQQIYMEEDRQIDVLVRTTGQIYKQIYVGVDKEMSRFINFMKANYRLAVQADLHGGRQIRRFIYRNGENYRLNA